VGDYRNLKVWRKAHELSLDVHSVAVAIRGSEYLALRSQMIRAAMSIPTNVVEGAGQKSGREFARFIRFAINSASELEYHLTVARDFTAIGANEFASLSNQIIEVRKMLHGLLSSVVKATSEVEASKIPM
jgi:four helix bundle protein